MNEITKTPLKTMPIRQIPNVAALLINDNARQQLAAVAAKHLNPERMMRVVANAIRTTPKLQECDPISFLGALMHCASMGLEPNTPLGHAYLIPFQNNRKNITEVQVVIGYKGLIDLARRSGQLATIHGDVVYDDDEMWSHEYGSNQHMRHRPGPRKGKRIGAYCYVKLNLGEGMTAEGHRFMSIEEIIAHRNQHSQGWKTAVRFGKTADSPWNEAGPQFESMAIKTVVRALANRGELPMSIEFMTAMETDDKSADYRAFAMAPDMGLPPPADQGDEIEGEAVDQETGEVARKADLEAQNKRAEQDAEAQRAAKQKADFEVAEAKRKKDRAEALAKENAAREATAARLAEAERMAARQREAEQQAQAEPEQTEAALEPDWSQNPWAKAFLKDVEDMGMDQAMDLHAADLERMKDERPGLHSFCMTEGSAIGG